MFKKWLDTQENASWDQLLRALRSRSVQLNTLANKIENLLIGNGKIIHRCGHVSFIVNPYINGTLKCKIELYEDFVVCYSLVATHFLCNSTFVALVLL